jgi:hypothetical protein
LGKPSKKVHKCPRDLGLLRISWGLVILSEAKNLNASGMLHFVQHDTLKTPRDPKDPDLENYPTVGIEDDTCSVGATV